MTTLFDLVDAVENGFDPETGEVLEGDALPKWDAKLSEKVMAIHAVLAQKKAMAAHAKAESKRLAHRAKRFEAEGKRLSGYVLECLQHAGQQKLVTETITASVRKGLQSVKIVNDSMIPDAYIRSEPRILKAELKHALQGGTQVPGCALIRGPEVLSWR